MSRQVIIFLLMLFSSFYSLAQEEQKRLNYSTFITPTTILHPAYPAIHVGMEKGISKWGVVAEVGVLLPNSMYYGRRGAIGLHGFSGEDNRGGFAKLEAKRYFNRVVYISGQIQYLTNDYERTDTFDETPELTLSTPILEFCTTCVEETYRIKKNMFGAAVKFGLRFDLQNNLYLDGYLGLGLNFHINKHTGNEELHKHPARTQDGLLHDYDIHRPGSYPFHLPVPTMGIRFGYVFGGKK